MSNIKNFKAYKPEITVCPFCKSKLVYKHTLSNKEIQFSDGSRVRIKNLGYKCSNESCKHSTLVHRSQTAAKLCTKGYTFSTKILALIYLYKIRHFSRDKICDILFNQQIMISDRNVDLIYNKYKKLINRDYAKIKEEAYQDMLDKYNEIRINLDFVTVVDHSAITIRDYFNGEIIGLFLIKQDDVAQIEKIVEDYVRNDNITYIATIRSFTHSFSYIKKYVSDKVEFIFFEKYS